LQFNHLSLLAARTPDTPKLSVLPVEKTGDTTACQTHDSLEEPCMTWEMLEDILAGLSPCSDAFWFLAYWGFLALLAGLESALPAFQQLPQRDKRWPTNLGLGVVNMFLTPLAPVSAVWGAQWAQSQGFGLLNAIGGPWWVAVVATFAIRSFAGYLFHVSMHKVPLFWRMHRVHHLDTHLDVSTSLRSHPLEFAAMFLTMAPIAIAFGLDPWALAAFEIVESLISLLSHANLRLPERLDRSLRWLLVTPNMHCLHHSSYQPETDSNYGQIFALWDRLFGTYSAAPRAGYDAMQIGLAEIRDERASDLWWQIKSPMLTIERASTEAAAPAEMVIQSDRV
jgi:sterol desaturase/sphingolipid hydroxylase (fatty acid hydroxylase superfamily)